MPRTKEQQTAYMRDYRARRKAESQAAIAQNVEADLKMVGDTSNRMAVGRTILSQVDVHAACDAKIAELEAELAALRSVSIEPLTDRIVTVHAPALDALAVAPKPSFLAAPDEDCICGHDRHAYHLGGPCTAKLDRKRKCPCGAFQADLGFD